MSGKIVPSQVRVRIPDPNGDEHYAYCPIFVTFFVPSTYPLDPHQLPTCEFEYDLITHPSTPKIYLRSNWLNEKVELAAKYYLKETFMGQQREILFDFIEWLRDYIPFPSKKTDLGASLKCRTEEINNEFDSITLAEDSESGIKSLNTAKLRPSPNERAGRRWEDEWEKIGVLIGEPLIDRKSTFRAQAIRVNSVEEVQEALRILYLNPKIEEATHNMYAYRIVREGAPTITDHDDDGEDCAGSRMALLLDRTQARNVLIVVSRWYGGVKLGPDRFRHINTVSLALLEAHNFIDPNRHDKGKKSSKK